MIWDAWVVWLVVIAFVVMLLTIGKEPEFWDDE